MSELLARRVSPQRGWEYLPGMRYKLRSPRPEHDKADPIEQEQWKKKLPLVVEKVQLLHPHESLVSQFLATHMV
jgi:hypothetical protein